MSNLFLTIAATFLVLTSCTDECEEFNPPIIEGIGGFDETYEASEGTSYLLHISNTLAKAKHTWKLPSGEEIEGDTLIINDFSESDAGNYHVKKENGNCQTKNTFTLDYKDLSPGCVPKRDILYMVTEPGDTLERTIVEVISRMSNGFYKTMLMLEGGQHVDLNFIAKPEPDAYQLTGHPYAAGGSGVGMYFEFGILTDFKVPKQEHGVDVFVRNEGTHRIGEFCNIRAYNSHEDEIRYMSAVFTMF